MNTSTPPLLTVAFPVVERSAADFMRSFSQAHSLETRVSIEPHFTLVFASSAIPQPDYVAHVSAVAAQVTPIRFMCKYAMLGADDDEERGHVFLVPDEGYADISRLHDALYAGPLSSQLRLDLPYVPHITIGTTNGRGSAKSLCDRLNADGVVIEGSLREVTVGLVRDARFEPLSAHRLGA